jgi:hypothetical protein
MSPANGGAQFFLRCGGGTRTLFWMQIPIQRCQVDELRIACGGCLPRGVGKTGAGKENVICPPSHSFAGQGLEHLGCLGLDQFTDHVLSNSVCTPLAFAQQDGAFCPVASFKHHAPYDKEHVSYLTTGGTSCQFVLTAATAVFTTRPDAGNVIEWHCV